MSDIRIKVASDAAANDSDKKVTVDSDYWEILQIRVEITATATAGNRIITCEVQDADDDIMFLFGSDTTRAASGTQIYCFRVGVQEGLAPITGTVMERLPAGLIMPNGWDLRIYDSAAVDAAADDMVIHVTYRDHT